MTARLVPTHGAPRALRGCVLAVSSAGLAIAAHAVGGGAAPDTGLAVVLTVLLAGAGTALADRRRSGTAILAALGGSQLSLHLLLDVLSTHQHETQVVDPVLMTAAHTVAAIGTALLLATAESAVFALASALGLVLPRRLVPPPAQSPLASMPVRPASIHPVLETLLRRVLARRGPPATA